MCCLDFFVSICQPASLAGSKKKAKNFYSFEKELQKKCIWKK
jgi:hypothetical protein